MTTFLRINSTGRSGSNFLSCYFNAIGYKAYHENYRDKLHVDSEVYNFFQAELVEIWNTSPKDFQELNISFMDHFFRVLKRQIFYQKLFLRKKGLLVDSDNTATLLTSLMIKKCLENGINFKGITLFRNPFKTIHAIYIVEGPSNYLYRARSIFSSDDNIVRSAEIWDSVYRMCLDFEKEKAHKDMFFRLNIKDFDDIQTVESLHDFLGIEFNKRKYEEFMLKMKQEGVRSSKEKSIRNSDLFHDFDFCFDTKELNVIQGVIENTSNALGLDLELEKEDYLAYHRGKYKSLRT